MRLVVGFEGVGFRVLCLIFFIVFVQWDAILNQKLLAFSNSAKVSLSNLSDTLLNHTLHPHKIKIGDASGRWFAINYWIAHVTTNVRWLQISHAWAISRSNRFSYFDNLITCNGPRSLWWNLILDWKPICFQFTCSNPYIHMSIHTTKISTNIQQVPH